jgi:glycine/D-amino acid oxidase-like deaminating enzyme
MDYTRDGRPIVGPLGPDPRRWVVAGFGGHGMPAGISVGKGIAEGIATGHVPGAFAPLAPSRFEELR